MWADVSVTETFEFVAVAARVPSAFLAWVESPSSILSVNLTFPALLALNVN